MTLRAPAAPVLHIATAQSSAAVVQVAGLSARESYVEGRGTVVALSGSESLLPAGNLVFVYARDRFGNVRAGGDDLFAMDPLMDTSLEAVQRHIGGGKYEIVYWWDTLHPKVAYEVCPRAAVTSAVAQLGECQTRRQPLEDDRVIAYVEIMTDRTEAVGQTDARASTTTCLTQSGAHSPCGQAQASAGVSASFAIESKNEFGAARYSGHDAFLVTLDGPERLDAHVRHLRLNYYE